MIGICSATLATALAALVWSIPKYFRSLRLTAGLLMFLALCVPGPMVGMLIIRLLNREFAGFAFLYDYTVTGVVLAQMFRLAPVATGFLAFVSMSISSETRQQMQLDGLSLLGRIRCLWPTLWRELVTLWGLLFVLSIGELSASILVLPPGVTTVSMRLFEMLHFGMRHQDSALCGVLVLLGGVAGLLVAKTLSARQ
jgi:iron(III) transport system permease protein